jgi:small-conductance mechanosensitive channel
MRLRFLLPLFFSLFVFTVFCAFTASAFAQSAEREVLPSDGIEPASSAASEAIASDSAGTGAPLIDAESVGISLIDRLSIALVKTRIPVDEVGAAGLLIRFAIALFIIIVQIVLIRIIWFLFGKLHTLATNRWADFIKPIKIKTIRVLDKKQILSFIHFLLRVLKWVVTIFQLFITLPIIFSLFPLTQNLAGTLFGYIFTPVKSIVIDFVKYIPNLFTIAIIIVIIRYVLRSLKFLSMQIEKEKITLPGFYPEWAQPTYNILRVLLYAFTIAVVYPYLPGSGSEVFRGVSVFVGVLLSLGSSSSIGNLVAGFVLTYMRPFKIGDLIKLNDITGFVVEKSPMVTRLRTHKNEYVTFPNNMVLGANVINYHTSAEEETGLIVHTEITFNYAMPWTKIHELLIKAALNTEYIMNEPEPFVRQTALNDFYANYEINAFTKTVDKLPMIYANLHKNIQNVFAEENIDLTAPHYYAQR